MYYVSIISISLPKWYPTLFPLKLSYTILQLKNHLMISYKTLPQLVSSCLLINGDFHTFSIFRKTKRDTTNQVAPSTRGQFHECCYIKIDYLMEILVHYHILISLVGVAYKVLFVARLLAINTTMFSFVTSEVTLFIV